MKKVASVDKEVAKLLKELEEIQSEMEWLEMQVAEAGRRGEFLSVLEIGQSFDFVKEVVLEVKEKQMVLFRSRKAKLRILKRKVKKTKQKNEEYEVVLPEEWDVEEWKLEEDVFKDLTKKLERKKRGGVGVKKEKKSGEEGGEKKELVVKKRAKLENVSSLKEEDKFIKSISVKRWVMFERDFKKKMKFTNQTDEESIVQLAQVIPPKMVNVLEEGGSGDEGRDLNTCFELLKEQEFGDRWLREMRKQFVAFKRTPATLDVLEFRRELAVVSEGAGYDLELGSGGEKSGKLRYKFMDCLTVMELIYWEEKGFDAMSCT